MSDRAAPSPTKPPVSVLEPIDRVNLVEEIVERITAYILGQGLAAGDQLPPEREFAAGFRVGRSTIREAIKSLRAVGIVEVTPRGPVVGTGGTEGLAKSFAWGLLITERGVQDALEAREAVEPTLARLAAERATDEEIARLKAILAEMRQQQGSDRYVGADLEFHMTIARAARNGLLLSIAETLQGLSRTWMTKNLALEKTKKNLLARSYREHLAIYRALRDRDPAAAASSMQAHLSAAGERLLGTVRRNT
jgi:DNA-binding FadR family transcriptional regulator